MSEYCYYFQIAGLRLQIQSPAPIAFRSYIEVFQTEAFETPDICFALDWSEQEEQAEKLTAVGDFTILKKENRFIRRKNIWIERLKKSFWMYQEEMDRPGWYRVSVPRELLEDGRLFVQFNIFQFLSLEDGLLLHRAFILHSSFVCWQEQGILFSAPSGTGKSTQADLWKKYEQADIYNGDRTVIRRIDGRYYGFGSPYAGSSGIYRNESAPIRAIVILSQAPFNRIERLRGKNTFLPLYRESLMNTWNPDYMQQISELIMDAAGAIPMYHLACRPDEGAVKLVKQMVFEQS